MFSVLLFSLLPLTSFAETLLWSDEFDDLSCVNGRPGDDWSFEQGFVRNNEDQWYQEDNAKCDNGELVITAQREWAKPNPNFEKGSADWRKATQWVNYTSSSLITKGRQQWSLPVRMEMRGKIDVRQGSWPAWWTIGANTDEVGWPKCGEIDIMEYYHASWQKSGVDRANFIYGESYKNPQTVSIETAVDAAWASSYHVWELEWTEQSMKISMDGEVLNQFTPSTAGDTWGSEKPVYMLVNQALGGCCGGDPSTSVHNDDNPLEYHVDYVRVYRIESQVSI